MSPRAARAFATALERSSGQQLTEGRRWRIGTALAPLMRDRGIDTLDSLATQMAADGDKLVEQVVEALLNNETFFFRDIGAFRAMADQGLGALAQRRSETRRLRIWSAGCSTGQEPYSLAMAVAGQPARWEGWDISILATDISAQAVARGREGLYPQIEIQRGLPVTEMLAGFTPEEESWRARPELRQAVRFLRHNLLDLPPPGKFDLILCRNVLLYLCPERRRDVFARLAAAIAPDGLLMLGAGETVLGQTDAFVSDPEQRGLYRPATSLSR